MKQIAGRYKVVEKLGTGLSGTVYSVKDGPKGPTVALKLSNPTEDSAHHLEREFFTLSQLDHANIVRVFDFGRTKNRRAYFTMELVKGKPFTKHTFKDKTKLCDAVAQILIALEYIHSKGLIHCDLKPENILIRRNSPKLLDFGLASVPEESAEVKGTINYIAPVATTPSRSHAAAEPNRANPKAREFQISRCS